MSDSRSPSRASSNDDDENTQLMRQQNNQPQQQQQQQQQGGGAQGLGGIGNAVGEVTGNLNKSLSGLGGITGQQQGGGGGDQDVAMQKIGSRKGADVNGNQLAPLIDNRTEEQKRLDDVGKKYKDDKSSLKIRIELDIDVEIHLSARVKGDITIGLL